MESPQNEQQMWIVPFIGRKFRYRPTYFALLFSIIGLFIFFKIRNRGLDLESCFYEDVETNNKCIDVYMHGTGAHGGMGNVAFELISFIGIAKQTKRIAIISHPDNLDRMPEVAEWFPNLYNHFRKIQAEGRCACFKKMISMSLKCCTVDKKSLSKMILSNESTIRIHQFYTQGISYISVLPSSQIKNLLRGSEKAIHSAKYELFPLNSKRHSTKNICVHTRRTDFVNSPLVYGSEEDFTQAATLYILEKEGPKSDVYVFGADSDFNEDTFRGWKNVFVSKETEDIVTNADWEFSRLYCDVVLLTQSASTYGWWMGYLSRGQKVYYSKKFSRPKGLEVQLTPSDFWPKEWIPLTLTNQDEIVEDPWK